MEGWDESRNLNRNNHSWKRNAIDSFIVVLNTPRKLFITVVLNRRKAAISVIKDILNISWKVNLYRLKGLDVWNYKGFIQLDQALFQVGLPYHDLVQITRASFSYPRHYPKTDRSKTAELKKKKILPSAETWAQYIYRGKRESSFKKIFGRVTKRLPRKLGPPPKDSPKLSRSRGRSGGTRLQKTCCPEVAEHRPWTQAQRMPIPWPITTQQTLLTW